mmetsp:Transcript_33054/g.105501  ORF Transcript_33054/g.105501 Transcript_33054/m.105501 type:complete len:203 (+) Transcript_33054:680-1288(+)
MLRTELGGSLEEHGDPRTRVGRAVLRHARRQRHRRHPRGTRQLRMPHPRRPHGLFQDRLHPHEFTQRRRTHLRGPVRRRRLLRKGHRQNRQGNLLQGTRRRRLPGARQATHGPAPRLALLPHHAGTRVRRSQGALRQGRHRRRLPSGRRHHRHRHRRPQARRVSHPRPPGQASTKQIGGHLDSNIEYLLFPPFDGIVPGKDL